MNQPKQKLSAVYVIQLTLPDRIKRYVGMSQNLRSRWAEHRNDLNQGRHMNSALQHDWLHYGKQNFEFHILKRCETRTELRKYEKHYAYKFGYGDREKCYNVREPGVDASDIAHVV